ncbi:glycoprotein UL22A [Human betaherpesvirus 5]|uniref:Glycoprotein UL22A n=1 Tax=Human cytomegalovirus TaxID=10359 RepID=V9PUP0_HCMV|nr:glycoprotein UL22A [Human betaherpesvirus 5]AKI11598.1 glycoprotein UL22A [Human betaherpesvirus 5]AKI15608.1 glycoprotein UL22A [Human betaherpesvirus 5]AKI17276.1 glycoprotein UL22A [Human betaherpesvirus 5]AKI26360.1 glycoprotein UL22A [Human betaherpesvirus 5]
MARRLWILSLLAVTLTVALAAPSQKSKRSVTVDQPNTSADGSNTTPSKNVTLSQGGSTTDGDEDYSGEEYDVLITDGDSSEHQQPQKTDEHKENQAKENEKKIQ